VEDLDRYPLSHNVKQSTEKEMKKETIKKQQRQLNYDVDDTAADQTTPLLLKDEQKKKLGINVEEEDDTMAMYHDATKTYSSPTTNAIKNSGNNSSSPSSSAVSQFYKTLDEITSTKRNDVINTLLLNLEQDSNKGEEDDDDNNNNNNNGDNKHKERKLHRTKKKSLNRKLKNRCWYPRAAAAAGGGNERGQDTLRWIVSAVDQAKKQREEDRYRIGLGKEGGGDAKQKKNRGVLGGGGGGDTKKETGKMKKMLLIGLVLMCGLGLGVMWFGLGCYGLYVILFGGSGSSLSQPFLTPTASSSSSPNSEIVIKIVREVVHVSSNGKRSTCSSEDGSVCMDALSSRSITKEEEKVMVQDGLVNSANLSPDVAEAVADLIGMDDAYN